MHEIEPFYNWEKYYTAETDELSPLYGKEYNLQYYENDIYGYYIHPLWDFIGSETLYIKILYVEYKRKFAIIELFGEWNDTLHNDIMHLKRNIIDAMLKTGITQFILIGENVFNFHGSEDDYYAEWFEDIEEGWIAALNFRDFVQQEMTKYNIDSYFNIGGTLDTTNWRNHTPDTLYLQIKKLIERRLG
jgi:hypothetical protein